MASNRRSATLIGLTAVGMWSLLGLMAAATGRVPPFLLNGLAFGLSGLGAIAALAFQGQMGQLRQDLKVWLIGVGGLFGFHFFYFTSLKTAPPVEANLINYTWPLLIVVFSGLLPGERLKPHHILGAALGLIGAALIVTKGRSLSIAPEHMLGYGAAIVSALIWSSYSIASRRMAAVPTGAVAGFCLATSALSFLCHVCLETTVWPETPTAWAAVAGLGALPLGAAFFVWDHGVKHGDIQVLGAASYLSPLMSTLFLILAGFGRFEWVIAAAAALITLGAVVASKDMIFRRRLDRR
ncbi:MAG: EamA family transporter [Ancalomicrobiaceae bacterium]|nr:EamA family transporter [Ancalomicrobiaceae bacterium]